MSSVSRGLIVQFCKAPIPGKVKTRMLSKLSEQESCDLHKKLALRVYENVSTLKNNIDYQLWVSSKHDWFKVWPKIDMHKTFVQQGESLGDKLRFTAEQQLKYYDFLIFSGSDCPFIAPDHIESVISYMRNGKDLVFIPAIDGGYVLIAVKKESLSVFDNISWGTEKVLKQSIDNAKELGLNYALLDEQADIDRPEDLARLEALDMFFT